MKALVLERRRAERSDSAATQTVAEDAGELQHLEAEEEMRTLTLTVPREDAWCFEQARLLARHVADGACGSDA